MPSPISYVDEYNISLFSLEGFYNNLWLPCCDAEANAEFSVERGNVRVFRTALIRVARYLEARDNGNTIYFLINKILYYDNSTTMNGLMELKKYFSEVNKYINSEGLFKDKGQQKKKTFKSKGAIVSLLEKRFKEGKNRG